MTRGIFIAGNESSLYHAVCAETLKRVERYASAVLPGRGENPYPLSDSERGKILLPWNPSSPISARTLALAAENRLGRIDEAFLVCSPPPVLGPAEALAPAETDKFINDQIKGWFFLIRELALIFKARGEGTLALALPDAPPSGGKDTPADFLGAGAAASFRALTQGLLASSFGAPYSVLGFTNFEAGMEADFAAWLFKIIDEGNRKNSGRWHKYSRLGFFR